jgi:aspartate/methionine/tyrosine aminotransferase
MPIEDIQEVAAIAIANDSWVLSDEIYSRLVYGGGSAPSVFAIPAGTDG